MSSLKQELKQFSGSETFYEFPLNKKIVFTEGVKYLADVGKAHWLLGEVALGFFPKIVKRGMSVVDLEVFTETFKAKLTLRDGDGRVLETKEVDYTDFPIEGVTTIWVIYDGLRYTIMLPTEY